MYLKFDFKILPDKENELDINVWVNKFITTMILLSHTYFRKWKPNLHIKLLVVKGKYAVCQWIKLITRIGYFWSVWSVGNRCWDWHLINWLSLRPINRIVSIIEYIENFVKTNEFVIIFWKITKKSQLKLIYFKVDYEKCIIDRGLWLIEWPINGFYR